MYVLEEVPDRPVGIRPGAGPGGSSDSIYEWRAGFVMTHKEDRASGPAAERTTRAIIVRGVKTDRSSIGRNRDVPSAVAS
jgi:hypothetical protein